MKRIAEELAEEEYYGYLFHSEMTDVYFSYISKSKELALKIAEEAKKVIADPDNGPEMLDKLGEREGVTLVSDEGATLALEDGKWTAYPDGYYGKPVRVKMLGTYSKRF